MTAGMLLAAKSTPISNSVEIHHITATSAPASIDDDQDIQDSSKDILSILESKPELFSNWDAILVACFSVHPLVPKLSSRLSIPVTGIFEASTLTAMSLLGPLEKWGVVTTGKFWEDHLTNGVYGFLGVENNSKNTRFAGVFSSRLTAGDFHTVSPTEVKEKLSLATRQLLASGNVTCVVMGCGGMAGLEDIIRSTAVEVYGESRAKGLYIIDGVKAGIMQLHQSINSVRIFR
ncbi:hypothetical protein QQS21_012033 [Conoideocrella luteorostrata]|uniref:Hydantoin racemase n=1 Tax=Conoideocrella luteorostrata TaxID=1105319 RepID=A0AAJ0FV92_9HYPO|nr:hypothetical protein QQS21_012033 [Conoideocrella luteorostrata]